jgi:phosphoglucomutase
LLLTPGCKVVIVDPYEAYVSTLEKFFDFELLKDFASKGNRILFDGMHGAGGPFGRRVLGDILGFKDDCFMRCDTREDFGGCHPDPNLTYGKELVERMGLDGKGRKTGKGEDFKLGAANDGDGDRNLICGKGVFVTPSDSLAVIADRWEDISSNGPLKGVARSMPSSAAVDVVAEKKGVRNFVTPTGWKFFGNLMDSEVLGGENFNPFLCGEESFGTGSSHIREKDGLWAVLAWLSILARSPSLTVEDVVNQHWEKYGRHYYARYDYEECGSDGANKMMENLRGMIGKALPKDGGDYELNKIESFSYTDPVTKEVTANQGMILSFLVKGSPARAVFRLSGTGSAGATVRMYLEKYDGENFGGNSQEELKGLGEKAAEIADLESFTGRKEPTVIT